MHELGVVFHVLDDVEVIAKENNVSHVEKVTLEIGQVSGIVHSYLRDVWTWAVEKREVAKGCKLEIEEIHARTHCDSCGKDYDTVPQGRTCPYCGSGETWLITGNEFIIKDITVPEV